ncbi:MAG: CRISPR-associated endoribonuclease Cas6 [Chloroflexota bacterium]|nr:CRISPR-associated endoribonuclease Cas6 [Chloroflexota bacterium]
MIADNQRLYAVVLRLIALRSGAVPRDHGTQVRAAFLSMIRTGDETLAQQLHDANIHKPYTISPLRSWKRSRDGAHHFSEGDEAEWRFTLMSEPTFEAVLRRYLLDRNLPHLRIGAMQFMVTDVFASQSHPESGSVTATELVERWQKRLDAPPSRILLAFVSPTVFSLGHDKESGHYRYASLPDLKLLFSSLRKRAVDVGLPPESDDFDAWIAQTARLTPLALDLVRVTVERRGIPAFLGEVSIDLGSDLSRRAYAHMLADLAFFTGVGYQTTCGLGQVRRMRTNRGE